MIYRCIPYEHIDKKRWNALVDIHPHGWWWQTTYWIDYVSCRDDHENLSFAIEDVEGRYVQITPLFYQRHEIQMEGEPCPASLVAFYDETDESKAALMILGSKILNDLYNKKQWCAYRFRETIPSDVKETGDTFMGPLDPIPWRTHVLDLPADWLKVRKSYRPLINKAQRECGVKIYHGNAFIELEKFHTLHRKANGRETRPIGTWAAMYEWMIMGNAIVVLVGDPPVAGAYFIRYKKSAYYASGASIEPDRQHAAVWAGIKTLETLGDRRVELGWHARPWDGEKAKSIEFFKSGFGGYSQWINAFTVK